MEDNFLDSDAATCVLCHANYVPTADLARCSTCRVRLRTDCRMVRKRTYINCNSPWLATGIGAGTRSNFISCCVVGNIFKSKREFLRVMLATLDKLLIANTKKCGMQVARDRVLIEMGIHPNGGMFWQDTSRRSVGPSFLF